MSVSFTVPGPVRGKGRPRTRVVSAKGGKKSFAQVYTDGKTRTYESQVTDCADRAMAGRPLLEGALVVTLTARFDVPASGSKRERAEKLANVQRPTKKPDMDNIAKILDALNGIVFKDDAQVCEMRLAKIYAPTPGLDILIEPLNSEAI